MSFKKPILPAVTVLILTILVTVSSCTESTHRLEKLRSIGNTSEILMVVQNEQQWEGNIGRAVREKLGREQYGLNQAEPLYKIAHVSISGFSDLLKKHRNILIVEVDGNLTEPKIEVVNNEWSDPQQVIRIFAASSEDWADTFIQNAAVIEKKFNKTERDRILYVFRSAPDYRINKNVIEKFGFKMVVPRDYMLARSDEGVIWFRKETIESSQGILITSEPYLDTAQFSGPAITARLNRFLSQYVPGPTDGSYMQLDEEYISILHQPVSDFPVGFTIESRGLWVVKNDFMGGPFVAYSFYDQSSGNIISILGYVYHPNKNKRDLLRQLEAMIYSVEFQ